MTSAERHLTVNIKGWDTETVVDYKYLGVHLSNKMDWSTNTDALYNKGLSRFHLLRGLRSFGVNRTLIRTFYGTVIASVIFYGMVCWSSGVAERDKLQLLSVVIS